MHQKKISACPGWLALSKDRLSFIYLPDRAEIVRKIFELSIGGLGSYSIANHLDRQNVPAFGPAPKWDHTTIDSILRNRATVGERQPKSYAGGGKKGLPVGAPIPDYYPAAIDEATFQAAQKARRRNLATGRGRKGENFTNIFAGLTTCAYCCGKIKFHNSNGHSKSLICERVLEGTGCIRMAWSYKNFESSVLHFLIHPALIECFVGEQRVILVDLAGQIKRLSLDPYNARFGIMSIMKVAVTRLELASAGSDPTPTLPEALICRDDPNRFFTIKLWNGSTYVGGPIV